MSSSPNQINESPPSFNLVRQPWIPVLMRDGHSETLSLMEVFARAPQISQVVAELPTVGAAIEGILQAILRRSVGVYYLVEERVSVASAAQQAWFDWQPVAEDVEEYLREWEDRFDLFDPVTPFFQAAGLMSAKGEVAGLEVLLADVPNGVPFLTMRRSESLQSIGFAEAARWLIHAQAYDPSGIRGAATGDRRATGGRVYPTGPGWDAWFGLISPRTGSLARDLLLATVPSGVGRLEFNPNADLPAWEREPASERPQGVSDEAWENLSVKELRDIRREPAGPSDILTWQARRIRLIHEGSRVTGVLLANGDPLDPQNRFPVEPRCAWRYSKPQSAKFKTDVYMPKEFAEPNSLWRGVESLFPTSVSMLQPKKNHEVIAFYGPAFSAWIAELSDEDLLGDTELSEVSMEVVGMVLGSMMAVVDDVVTDSLTLPVSLLREENRRYRIEVEDWIRRAEKVASAVAGFAADLKRAAGDDNTDGAFAQAKGAFLATARTRFLSKLSLLPVGDVNGTKELGHQWSQELRCLALEQRSDLLAQAGTAAIIGHTSKDRYLTAGNAERCLRSRLNKILGDPTVEASTNADAPPSDSPPAAPGMDAPHTALT